MKSEASLENVKNEVLRKIGRNLINFQIMERVLKFLVASANISTVGSKAEGGADKRIAGVNKKTMGNLVRRFVDDVYSESEKIERDSDEVTEITISSSFKIEGGVELYESRRQELKSVVDSRNELVHHFESNFDFCSIDGCQEAGRYLDSQHEKLLSELNGLLRLKDALVEGFKSHVEYLSSEAGKRDIKLLLIQQRRPVQILAEVASRTSRSDGWALLNTAAQLIHQEAPGSMADIKREYGYGGLKELMVATKLFEICNELTDRGGMRTLYRLRPCYQTPIYSAFKKSSYMHKL